MSNHKHEHEHHHGHSDACHHHEQEHHHHHSHLHGHAHDVENIKVAFFLNFGFAILEIVGGFLTNSVAILSDAVHDLGDSLSLGMAWYFQKFSRKGRNQKYTYGYKRFSLIGAMINTIVLVTGSIFILKEAIPRLVHPEQANAKGMILLAILGVVINGAAMLKLRQGKSLNERVVSLHLLEDVLGWVAVLIGAVIMLFADLPIIDPILSILIALFILFNVFKNMRELFRILLQGKPDNVHLDSVKEHLKGIEEVIDIHDVHVWTADGMFNVITLHVVLEYELNFSQLAELKKQIRKDLRKLEIHHTTIEFELKDEECYMEDCLE